MSRKIDMGNSRYQGRYGRPFGELCTRLRMENGEVIGGVSCCYGLTSDMTDDYEKACLGCAHFQAWQ